MDSILYLLALSVVTVLRKLPLSVAAKLGRACGALAYYLDGRHRRVAQTNLRLAFPERSEGEILALAKENFRRLGENYASAVNTAFMDEPELASRIEIIGGEKLMHQLGDRRNLIVAIGHFGNFEIYARTRWAAPGFQFAATYRGLKQPSLNKLMQRLRERSSCWFFERRTEAAGLRMALNKGRLILGLLADQHAGRSGAWLPFFGRPCSTNLAPAVLSLRYDAKLHAAFCFRIEPGRWRIEVTDEIPTHTSDGKPRDSEEIMREVNGHFEAAVRKDPANWFWVHNRWKTPPPGEAKQPQQSSADATVS